MVIIKKVATCDTVRLSADILFVSFVLHSKTYYFLLGVHREGRNVIVVVCESD